MQSRYVFTSESVTEGHPDKVCDQISDAILDAYLANDPYSRVAVECLATHNCLIIAGEVSSNASCDINAIARNTIKQIGYTTQGTGFDAQTVQIQVQLHEQSRDIAQGVLQKELGAGDQGMMFGYACDETPEFMPAAIVLAHKLTEQLTKVRKNKQLPFLLPDGKSQVTVEYAGGKVMRVPAVVIAAQHEEQVSFEKLQEEIKEFVITPVLGSLIDQETLFYINATGRFVHGGPSADTGLTGRKIISDTYGGAARHGGGAFSGKDATKMDRSGAYAARHIAKNIVAAGLAKRCEVQLSYAIGVSKPVSVFVDCFGTAIIPEEKISKIMQQAFALTPQGIIDELELRTPIFQKTAAYGHFGRELPEFKWENIKKMNYF